MKIVTLGIAIGLAALTAGAYGSYGPGNVAMKPAATGEGLSAIIAPVQTCLDGTESASGCAGAKMQLARGNECPASSGAYCSDEFPYCCGTPGNYYCAKDVNSC